MEGTEKDREDGIKLIKKAGELEHKLGNTILALASGTIALSVSLVDRLGKEPCAKPLLFTTWICLLVAIIARLADTKLESTDLGKTGLYVYLGKLEELVGETKGLSKTCRFLNRTMLVSFVFGIVLMFVLGSVILFSE